MHGGDPFVFVLIIFGMFMVMRRRGFGPYGRTQRRLEQEVADLRAQQTQIAPQRGPTLDQVQMLEDRVRVLERIVTDRGYGLANEIEALRDRRAARETEEKN